MHSSYYSAILIDQARSAYAAGVKVELRWGYGVNNRSFQRAYTILMDLCTENDVNIKPSQMDQIDGLMAGDLKDVREAFRILGGLAAKGVENAKLVERKW